MQPHALAVAAPAVSLLEMMLLHIGAAVLRAVFGTAAAAQRRSGAGRC